MVQNGDTVHQSSQRRDPGLIFGFASIQWRLYLIEMPSPAAALCESGGSDAMRGGRPLSLKAWLLNDLSSRK